MIERYKERPLWARLEGWAIGGNVFFCTLVD